MISHEPLPERLMTIPAAAAYLGLHHVTIRRYITRGQLKAYRVGVRALRIDERDVAALLNGGRP